MLSWLAAPMTMQKCRIPLFDQIHEADTMVLNDITEVMEL